MSVLVRPQPLMFYLVARRSIPQKFRSMLRLSMRRIAVRFWSPHSLTAEKTVGAADGGKAADGGETVERWRKVGRRWGDGGRWEDGGR